jgi:FixJ family two-component response regulator
MDPIIAATPDEIAELIDISMRTPPNQRDEVFEKWCRSQLAKEDPAQARL